MTMTRKRKIFWSYGEQQRIAREAAKLMDADPRLKLLAAVRQAQAAWLPPERQRVFHTASLIGDAVLAQIDEQRGRPQASAAPSVADEPLVVPGHVLRVEVPIVPDMVTVLTTIPTGLLIGTLWTRLATWIAESQAAWLQSAHKALPVRTVPDAPRYPNISLPERRTKLRIAIVGLWKEKIQEVQRAVSEKVEVIYLEREQATPSIPTAIDDLIVVTTAVKHRWFEAAKAAMPREHLHLVEGGASAIIQKCFDLASRQNGHGR